jgi:hypothetical protein
VTDAIFDRKHGTPAYFERKRAQYPEGGPWWDTYARAYEETARKLHAPPGQVLHSHPPSDAELQAMLARAQESGRLDALLDHANGNSHCLETERSLRSGQAYEAWWQLYLASYQAKMSALRGEAG